MEESSAQKVCDLPRHLQFDRNLTDHCKQDRLREYADSFDGLLSLIPAKLYYGEDTSVRHPIAVHHRQEAHKATRINGRGKSRRKSKPQRQDEQNWILIP
jgi:hypothetical protein